MDWPSGWLDLGCKPAGCGTSGQMRIVLSFGDVQTLHCLRLTTAYHSVDCFRTWFSLWSLPDTAVLSDWCRKVRHRFCLQNTSDTPCSIRNTAFSNSLQHDLASVSNLASLEDMTKMRAIPPKSPAHHCLLAHPALRIFPQPVRQPITKYYHHSV